MSTSSPDMITCIYCKREQPPSREHVLPTSLGGDLVRPMLCRDCNSRRLSHLDQALGERSLVALLRAAYTPATAFDVKLGGEHFALDPDTRRVLVVMASRNCVADSKKAPLLMTGIPHRDFPPTA